MSASASAYSASHLLHAGELLQKYQINTDAKILRAFYVQRDLKHAEPDPGVFMILLVFPAMFVLVVTSLMSWTVIGGLLKGWIFLVVLLEAGANATALVLANKIQERNDKKRSRKMGNVTKGLSESDHMLHMEDMMGSKTLLHDIGISDYFVDKEDLSIKETLYSLGSCALHLCFFVISCLLFWRHTTKTSLASLRCSI